MSINTLGKLARVCCFFIASCLVASTASVAQTLLNVQQYTANTVQSVSFSAAQSMLFNYSWQLAAAQADLESKTARQEAVAHLGAPTVILAADSIHYNLDAEVNLNKTARTAIENISGGSLHLPSAIQLPNTEIRRKGNAQTVNALVAWPIYTGGKITATKDFIAAQTDEAAADMRSTNSMVYTELVSRYFGAQLAQKAASLRQEALQAIMNHDHTAQRMLEEGMIARVERLQAKVALEEAKRDAEHAINQAKTANIALQRLLQSEQALSPTTPLFVSQRTLAPLQEFIDIALANHPGLAKVAAKKEQAEALHKADESLWKPGVTAFAQQQLDSNQKNRMAGVSVHWTLWSPLDRRSANRSALAKIQQAEYSDQQAREDISVLVEMNWRAVQDARQAYFALDANIELANEFLRLRQAGLREGTSTVSDLIDAQVSLQKVHTEQAQAANIYIQALIQLLTSAGVPDQFETYLNAAHTQVKS